MTVANIGKALANQAVESTKSTIFDAVLPPKPGEVPAPVTRIGPPEEGAVILGQIQAMQRSLKEDQELVVTLSASGEHLRVTEVFVPTNQVLVFGGVDSQGNVTRIIAPAHSIQLVCKIMKIAPGSTALRVNVLTPKPQPKPAA